MTLSTILVTGCAGFVGSKVVEMLCARQDIQVVGIDNVDMSYDPVLKHYRLQELDRFSNFIFCEQNIEDCDGLSRLFSRHAFDAVIHLAARAGVRQSMLCPSLYAATNRVGSLNILEAMRVHGVPKIVLASTSSLYAGQTMPFSEDVRVNPPVSPYALSKKAAEELAASFSQNYGIDVSVVRYFTVYGPAGRPDMSYFRFIQSIYNMRPISVFGDGNQARDFTYIDDVARGTIAALQPVGFEIFNLGRGQEPVSINAVIRRLEQILDRKAVIQYEPIHVADMESTWADITKALNMLDWKPVVDIDTGLRSCVDWFLNNLPWSSQIKLVPPRPEQVANA